MTWRPLKRVSFSADFTAARTAPSLQALLAPAVVSPGVQMFDFVQDETVYVTRITGGDEDLRASDNKATTIGLSVGPFESGAGFTANFERRRVIDAIGIVPPVTAAVESAFPDRFVRDASGTLIEVDDRSTNLALEEKDDLNWGFYLQVPPFQASPSSVPTDVQLRISVFDTWYFRDTILVRGGAPELDLLNGAPSRLSGTSVAGTLPRNAVDIHTDLTYKGFAAQLRTRWHSATELNSGTASSPDSLHFSALSTVDLKVYADLGQLSGSQGHAWSRGMRVSFLITNLFDTHQKVRDAMGATPAGFEPGYVDPLGRMLTLRIRKVF
jgi:hypothetical protein